jgi:hypothetical protein
VGRHWITGIRPSRRPRTPRRVRPISVPARDRKYSPRPAAQDGRRVGACTSYSVPARTFLLRLVAEYGPLGAARILRRLPDELETLGAVTRQAARNGGGRETGVVGAGLEPQRFADTCGIRCRRAFHRSYRTALASSARRCSRRRLNTPTETNTIITGREVNKRSCISLFPDRARRLLLLPSLFLLPPFLAVKKH